MVVDGLSGPAAGRELNSPPPTGARIRGRVSSPQMVGVNYIVKWSERTTTYLFLLNDR